MSEAVIAAIRPAAFHQNLTVVRRLAPGCRVLAVIKANAYGHGLVPVARMLDGADAFAVARLEEAEQLRAAGIDKRIVVLAGFSDREELARVLELQLDAVVHAPEQVELIERGAPPASLSLWLKVDTGMGRLGLLPAQLEPVHRRLREAGVLARPPVAMTHLACADDVEDPATADQLQRFLSSIPDWPGDRSIANSAAILRWPGAVALDGAGESWVRPGLMLYGVSPMPDIAGSELGLRPAMSLETRLIAVKRVPAGSRVGYGGTWRADREAVIGVAAAGYADGYPWRLPSGTPVLVGDTLAPLAGRVSMDMITIDLTRVAEARVGMPVVLWGDRPLLEDLARAADTIPYTLMTGISRRVALRIDEDTAACEPAPATVA